MVPETLRYATVVLSQMEQTAIFAALDRSEAVTVESTRYVGPSENDHYIGLLNVRGDLTVVEELFDASDQVLRYAIAGTDGYGLVYAHYRDLDPIEGLIAILYRHDLVVDWPMVHQRPDGEPRTRLTVIGTSASIRRAAADLPSRVSLSVERIEDVSPRQDGRIASLTDRQRSLLRRAIREGYYEVPRRTTHRELADSLGLSPGTVSDRLQRIERRVMNRYADAFL